MCSTPPLGLFLRVYDYDGRISRQKLKKVLKAKAKAAAKPRVATGKARRCLYCKYWIQMREIFYNGKSLGKVYIHVNTPPAVIDAGIHRAEPRPIPRP